MKKFLFVVTLSLSALGAENSTTHAPADAAAISSALRSSVATQPDKAAKLMQYINACLVQRPSTDDDIKKLLQ